MATKLDRKTLPAGHNASDFVYAGRPAKDQGDFGSDVGLADMACVNQFGDCNNAKYYHGGVVKSSKNGTFFVYLEWGRMKAAKSWNGSFGGGDYQFVECSGESDAREFFSKQMNSKNTKRLQQRSIGGKTIWTSYEGEDGYLVQKLATREKGLPDAYAIKDNSGVIASTPVKVATSAPKATTANKTFHPQVVSLATSLVGGTSSYSRSMAQASGVTPTMDAINEVRNDLIPLALKRIQVVGNDVNQQVRDGDLVAISKMVSAVVPRPIPRSGISDVEAILSSNNILVLQQDLDAFESALLNEDFSTASVQPSTSPDSLLNAKVEWIDPNSKLGTWVVQTFKSMSKNRHAHLRGTIHVLNVFQITRPDRDAAFVEMVKKVSANRKNQSLGNIKPELQPASRPDISDIEPYAKDANVFLGIHGTRSINVAPILQTNLRLPKTLSGVHITGAAFGGGIYFADDYRKSHGYVSDTNSYYNNGGHIRGRGFFMFLNDVIGGKFYYPRSAWSIGNACPDACDAVYAHPRHVLSLANNEYVVFNSNYQRIRYLIEATF